MVFRVGILTDPSRNTSPDAREAFGRQTKVACDQVLRDPADDFGPRFDKAAIAIFRLQGQQTAGPALRADKGLFQHQPPKPLDGVVGAVACVQDRARQDNN